MNLPMNRRATTPPITAATLASAIWPLVSFKSFLMDVIRAAGANEDQNATMKASQLRWNAMRWGVGLPQNADLMVMDLPSES